MIKSKSAPFLCLIAFALSSACGGHAKPKPNDEVTVPMTVEDEAAVNEADSAPDSEVLEVDAGLPPAP